MIDLEKVFCLFCDVGMSEPRLFIPFINPVTNEADFLPAEDSDAADGYDAEELEELQARIHNDPNWLKLPDRHELGLGSRLPLRFADEYLRPADCDLVYNFFRHRGAYSNFRALLDRLEMTDKWYQFQNDAIRNALKEWLQDNDIEFSE